MTATLIGPGLTAVVTILFFVTTWLSFRSRRVEKQNSDLVALRVTNVAYARRMYRLDILAAQRGWDLDPSWPEMPKELTPEFLAGRAQGESNPELDSVAKFALSFATELANKKDN